MKTRKHVKSRRGSLAGRLHRGVRKFLAVALSASIIAGGMPVVPAYATDSAEDEDVQEFSITSEDLREALQNALIKGSTVDEGSYKFTGVQQEVYEDLFYGADVYELFPEIEDDKNGKLTLKVFARLTGDHELDSLDAEGDDEIIFMLLNRTEEEESARIYVDDYVSDIITVVSRDDVVLEPAEAEAAAEETEADIQIEIEPDAEAAAEASAAGTGGGSGAGGYSGAVDSEVYIFDHAEDEGYQQEYASGNEGAAVDYASDNTDNTEAASDDAAAGEEAGSGVSSYENDDAGESVDAGSEKGGSGKDASYNEGSSEGGPSGSDYDSGSDSSDNGSGSSDDGADSSYSDSGSTDSGSGNSDRGSESSESGSDNADSGTGSSDSRNGSDTGSSDTGSASSSSSGSSDGDSESSGNSGSGSSDNGTGSSESGSGNSDNSSGNSDNSSGSSDSSSGGSDSSSGSSDSGSGSSGSSSSESSSGSVEKSGETASLSVKSVSLLTAAMADIVIEIDGDDVTATAISGDYEDTEITIDSEVAIASSSNADADDDDDTSDSDGYIKMEGEVYEAVIVNARRSGVAFVTTLEDLGVEEGITIEGSVYTASDGDINVTVIAPAGALPEDAELSVTRFDEDSEEYAEAAEAIDLDAETTGMAALDISFLINGEEIEPEEEVQVIIDVSDILPEDADTGTLKVTHLEEKGHLFESLNRVKAVVVADEDEGYIDEENGIVTFSVENFSTFTVTWDNGTEEDGLTITVHVYNMNGTSIDEELDDLTYSSTNGIITISNLLGHVHANAEYDNEYTFVYATVVYETEQITGASYDSYTIGGEGDSVTSISKSGTSYTVVHNGTEETVYDPYLITIHLYYSVPMVTLDTENSQDNTVNFITTSDYFQGNTDEATYTWTLTNDSLGTITKGENGTATFTWNDTAQVGNQVTVVVTMTVGTETASDTYTLTYGTEAVTITVTNDGTAQAGAHVALCTGSDGSYTTAATGVTGVDGTVTLYVVPGTYTVGVTYVTVAGDVVENTYRYTGEGSVTVSENGTGSATVALGDALVSGPNGATNGSSVEGADPPYYYEHIDVKIAVAETEDSNVKFSDLDAVYVYDKYGNLIYWSDDLIENEETTDFNCAFDMNEAEDIHSIVVSSEDTIILVYEVIETYEDGSSEYKTYTISFNSSSTYPDGEYYQYTDVNAWQLCNSIYNTSITEAEWETAVEEGTEAVDALFQEALGQNYNSNGISISGLSYIQVADYLCDTRTTGGQAGLDIAIDVGAASALGDIYNIRIAKILEDAPESLEASDLEGFTFTLTELKSVTEGAIEEETWSAAEENIEGEPKLVQTTEHSWTKQADGNWLGTIDLEDFLEYEAEEGTVFYYYILSENDAATATAEQQYYGIKVAITYSSLTGTADVVVTYCELTQSEDEENTYTRTSGWSGITGTVVDNETYYSISFINKYITTEISGSKVWVNDSESDRPDSITVYLFADSNPLEDEECKPYASTEATAEDDWTWSFKDLPIYNADGNEIVYTVFEGEIDSELNYLPSYTTDEDEDGNISITITNAIPEVHKYVSDPTFGESVDVDTDPDDLLHKDEADNNNTLEYRMEADHIGGAHNLVLHDFLDDQLDISTLEIESVTLYADEGDEGTSLVENVDYTVTAGECTADCGLDGCSFEIHVINDDVEDLSADAYVIVIFDIEVKEGIEDFDDNYVDEIDNDVGLSFTVFSIRTYIDDDGEEVYEIEEEDEHAEPDETETYSYGFDLYKYDDNSNEPLAGVEFILSKDGTDGTVYAQFETTSSPYLLSDWAASKDDATVIVTGSDGNAVIEGLHDGTYFIEETKPLSGYQEKVGTITVTITVNETDPKNPTIEATNATADGSEVEISNTPISDTESDKIEIIGSKTWRNDTERNRPGSITIRLYADGTQIDSKNITADDNWQWTFSDLDKYSSEGVEIVYTITEDSVSGYDTTINGYNVTNTRQSSTSTNRGGSSGGGGGGSGSGSSSGGSSSGGPGSGDGGSGEGDIWDLLPIPSTGQGRALLFGATALAVSTMALIVLLLYKRREKREA